jgi:hypothetical protein
LKSFLILLFAVSRNSTTNTPLPPSIAIGWYYCSSVESVGCFDLNSHAQVEHPAGSSDSCSWRSRRGSISGSLAAASEAISDN